MGPWAAELVGGSRGGWGWVDFEVPSDPSHSVSLGFYDQRDALLARFYKQGFHLELTAGMIFW